LGQEGSPHLTLRAHCQTQHFHYNSEVMNVSNLSAAQLRKAADLTEKIEAFNAELQQIIGKSDAAVPVASSVAPKKRGRPRKVVAGPVVPGHERVGS
jgi:hypothetical protein